LVGAAIAPPPDKPNRALLGGGGRGGGSSTGSCPSLSSSFSSPCGPSRWKLPCNDEVVEGVVEEERKLWRDVDGRGRLEEDNVDEDGVVVVALVGRLRL